MTTFIPDKENTYALLDSGEGMKLERFGDVVLSRPDPEALWKKNLPETEWQKAQGVYERSGATGSWQKNGDLPKDWTVEYGGLSFELRPTSFKHVGIFPEQKVHWDWMRDAIEKSGRTDVKAINLFAYTGGATLAAAQAGAEVVHVDSSKVAIDWARKNAELSGLSDKPIRWIEDDVLTFLRREVKRGNKYDVVVMDPPAFGHGAGDKLWKIEKDFYELFDLVMHILSDKPIAVIVNGYTAGYSPLTLENNVKTIGLKHGGVIETGELALLEENTGRLLPAGVFSRWKP